MENLIIRPALSPDIELLSKIEHCVKTQYVWQMSYQFENQTIVTHFYETHLPREMRVTYPYSPDLLAVRWKNYSALLVACVDAVPVGYISLITHFSPNLLWIKDLVVDEMWRLKGIASSLLKVGMDWKAQRGISKMMLEISSKNYPAICFARKSGFEFSGFNDNYFVNNDIALFFSWQ